MIEIEGYEIVGELGEGGMASVYKAIQFPLDRVIALKVLFPHLHSSSAQFGERFERETKILAKFSHPGIVRVYDAGKHNDNYYLAMEMLEGGTLTERMKGNQLKAVADVLTAVQKIAEALDHSHKKQIIHRDIKPDNILFRSRESQEPVLADYGIAKSIDTDQSLTVDAAIIGSPAYMSPEQALGKELTDKTDVFSLGVVFHEAVTGKLPFACSNIGELALSHREGLADTDYSDPNIRLCQDIWKEMLAIDPAQRMSASEVVRTIQRVLPQIDSEDNSVAETVVRILSEELQEENTQGSDDSAAATSEPKKYVGLLVASLFIVGAVLGAYFYFPESGREQNALATSVQCCSEQQLRESIQSLWPSSIRYQVASDARSVLDNNVVFADRWVFQAPGYQKKTLPAAIDSMPEQVLLEPQQGFSPEEFHDYQGVLVRDGKTASGFVSKHPWSVFTPIVSLLNSSDTQEFDAILQVAEAGDPVAQFQLSEIYDNGIGAVEKNTAQAERWASAASEQGYLPGSLQSFVFSVEAGDIQAGSQLFDSSLRQLAQGDSWLAKFIYASYKKNLAEQSGSDEPGEFQSWLALLSSAAAEGDYQSHQMLADIYSSSQFSSRALGISDSKRQQLAEQHRRKSNQLLARLLR